MRTVLVVLVIWFPGVCVVPDPIEVKGRVSTADTVTVTRNEILYSLNKPDDFILGIVEFREDDRHRVRYVRSPFQREPDFGVTSVNYDLAELLGRATEPS